MSSASGTMSAGGQIILNSTPRGLDPTYYARYEGARTGKNNFKVVEINWYEDPRYNEDLIWIRGEDFVEEKEAQKYKELKIWVMNHHHGLEICVKHSIMTQEELHKN
jgi:hypothetical protein